MDHQSMDTIEEYFPSIRLINLPTRPDRLRRARRQLGNLRYELLVASKPSDAAGWRTAGSRGCVESHIRCFEEAQAKNQNVLIFEDDVILHRRFAPALARAIAALRGRPWKFFYVGHTQPRLRPVADGLGMFEGFDQRGTHAYALHADVLGPYLQWLRRRIPDGLKIDIDGLSNVYRREIQDHAYAADPSVAFPDGSISDVTTPRLPQLRYLLWPYRTLRAACTRLRRGNF